LFRFFGIFGLPFQAEYLNQPGPKTPGQVIAIEGIALARVGCVGLCLWVRSANIRAIRFYKKTEFAMDPTGPVQRDGGPPHASMRKRLPDR